MRNWLLTTWDSVRTSLWAVPALMTVFGAGLAVGMLQVDAGYGAEDRVRAWWINSGSGEDARNLLSTLLAAIIAMASMAFSVTVVALSLAANTYGPRLIRVFQSDRRTHIVLGLFVMTIVYSLIVLRSVHGGAPAAEVPHASVTIGTALALLAVLALLAFIQGVARSIAADEVVRRVRRELDATVAQLPELGHGRGAMSGDPPADLEQAGERIALPREGYVQAVDYVRMARWAERHDAILLLDFRAGDFVVDGDRRLLVYPAPSDAKAARREIGRFIVSGNERTPTQDLEFAIRHLVEVALRALSPGINDPFTAKAVIDRLRGALSRLAGRSLPPPQLHDAAGRLRVLRPVMTYGRVVDAAFHQIRQAGSSKAAVLIHMLEAITAIAGHTRSTEQRNALMRHAELVLQAARRDVAEPADQQDVEGAFGKASQAVEAAGTNPAG